MTVEACAATVVCAVGGTNPAGAGGLCTSCRRRPGAAPEIPKYRDQQPIRGVGIGRVLPTDTSGDCRVCVEVNKVSMADAHNE